jgi:4-hydroxy-3-polyprenylbenzoate decarboxylase
LSNRNEFYHRSVPRAQLDWWVDNQETGCETGSIRAENMAETRGQIVTVGVTGASGAILAQRALALLEADTRVARVHLVVTETGQRLFAEELGIASGDLKQLPTRILGRSVAKIEILPNKDIGASIASGSYEVNSMIVVPCSMGTLAAIANGTSDDLVARAADVMLKEGRKLVLCIRDTPFNRVHLENMMRAQQAGAVIMPVIPAFYHHPKTIDDLVTQYLCRALAQIGLPQEKMYRWTGQAAAKKAEA